MSVNKIRWPRMQVARGGDRRMNIIETTPTDDSTIFT